MNHGTHEDFAGVVPLEKNKLTVAEHREDWSLRIGATGSVTCGGNKGNQVTTNCHAHQAHEHTCTDKREI